MRVADPAIKFSGPVPQRPSGPVTQRSSGQAAQRSSGPATFADWTAFLESARHRPTSPGGIPVVHQSMAIMVVMPELGPLAHHPALLFKLRGALGSSLMEGGCEGSLGHSGTMMTCTCNPVCPALLLFGTFDVARPNAPGEGLAKPFVLAAWQKDRDLCLRLTLFGRAADHAGVVRLALLDACRRGMPWPVLAGDVGLTLLSKRPAIQRTSIMPLDLADPGRFKDGARMNFVTGLEMNARTEPLGPGDIFDLTVSRIRGVAPWFGICLDEHDMLALRAQWLDAVCDFTLDDAMTYVTRQSSRSGEQWRSHQRRATLTLDSPLSPPLRDVLVLGERTHVGRGAVNGLGRYRLSPL